MNFSDIATRELKQLQAELESRVCPDQYFGKVSIIEEVGNLNQRRPAASRPSSENCLLLILESPHIKEFHDEPGPAKGTTGRNIARYLRQVAGLESFKEHGLILINAIQYQCSLGVATEKFRDRVFRAAWKAGGRTNFISRIQALHSSNDIVVNCCTKGAKTSTGNQLRTLVQDAIEEALPKVEVVRRNHPSSWHFRANRERLSELQPNPSIERTRPGKPGRASHVKR